MNKQDSAARTGTGLLLVRQPGERILIGDNIVVTLVNSGQSYATIGIRAPQDVVILREELKEVRED